MSAEAIGQVERRVVVACHVMAPELTYLTSQEGPGVGGAAEIIFLDHALHRTPGKLAGLIQAKIDRVAPNTSRIVLGYGLCSNGVVGVTAKNQEVFIPRCHDCITLFIGSPDRYQDAFRSAPGTYYLTPGWIAEQSDPLGIIQENVARYGLEKARWMVEGELKHYTRIAFINTGVGETEHLRARAMQNAAFLEKRYEEIPGSLDCFRELLYGPYADEKFLRLCPGDRLTQEMFL